jgi:predicted HAD superfamily phosphohydrolase
MSNNVLLEEGATSMSPGERDELLQALLVAASFSGDAVVRRLDETLLELAGREWIDGASRGE